MTADDDGVTWACRKCGVLVADRLLHDGHCPAQRIGCAHTFYEKGKRFPFS